VETCLAGLVDFDGLAAAVVMVSGGAAGDFFAGMIRLKRVEVEVANRSRSKSVVKDTLRSLRYIVWHRVPTEATVCEVPWQFAFLGSYGYYCFGYCIVLPALYKKPEFERHLIQRL